MRIGEIINSYLQENEMSQRQFAKICGMSNGYISMLVKNKNTHSDKPIVPSLSSLLSISKALGMSLDQLLEMADDIQIDISAAKNLSTQKENNDRVNEFVGLFSKLTEEQQLLIISQIKGILSNQ